jgi:hypothetical protein
LKKVENHIKENLQNSLLEISMEITTANLLLTGLWMYCYGYVASHITPEDIFISERGTFDSVKFVRLVYHIKINDKVYQLNENQWYHLLVNSMDLVEEIGKEEQITDNTLASYILKIRDNWQNSSYLTSAVRYTHIPENFTDSMIRHEVRFGRIQNAMMCYLLVLPIILLVFYRGLNSPESLFILYGSLGLAVTASESLLIIYYVEYFRGIGCLIRNNPYSIKTFYPYIKMAEKYWKYQIFLAIYLIIVVYIGSNNEVGWMVVVILLSGQFIRLLPLTRFLSEYIYSQDLKKILK